jgi:hypothetical protein
LDFTSVAAGAQAWHGGPTNAIGIAEPDPLTLMLYLGATHDRDISEDPMVEEFIASLVGNPIVAWPSLEILPSTLVTPQLSDEASVVAPPS